MKNKTTAKNLGRTIKNSFGRFLAIVLIIALGASMFVGLLSTKTDMVATGQKFLNEQNMFDLRLLSTYGWTQKEVDAVRKMTGVTDAEGQISMDAVVLSGESEEGSVYKLHSIPERINQVYLLGGRMPESPDECLLDGFHVDDSVLGREIVLSPENSEDTMDSLACHTYTVVGYVSTPLYMDLSRGSTSLGNGSVSGYLYLMPEAFDMDVFTEIAVTISGEYEIYSDAFTQALEDMAEQLQPQVTVLAEERFAELRQDAEQQYAEGMAEYESGLLEYEQGREEALQKLADALAELEAGQLEIDENMAALQDGYAQLNEAQAQLDEQAGLLQASKQELLAAKQEAYGQISEGYTQLQENEKLVEDGLQQIADGLQQIEDGIVQIDDGISALEDGLEQLADGLEQLETAITLKQTQVSLLESTLKAAENALFPNQSLIESLRTQLETAQQELAEYQAQQAELLQLQQTYSEQLESVRAQREELLLQKQTLLQTRQELENAKTEIQAGYTQLNDAKLQADLQFASAEAQLEAGQLQLDEAQALLDENRAELDAGAVQLADAQAQLDAGRAEYEAGKATAEAELAEAELALQDAAAQLADARAEIDAMAAVQLYILDRNTNSGYIALDNNSDIVSGVSRVFPAFFLLVAALVCITTMTRMVEEERTQIGTMKALGYSNGQIISKYLIYAGIAALVGCGLGTVLGSIIFPTILWNAYKILFNITPNIVLQMDWALCGAVVLAYTVVMLLVTWYCCRRSLREEPAELIRPRAPTSGKKIWMEYLPVWKKMSFLNKVMLRNVFRYKQRMLMMLIGVGGCTALLLTGFGLRDSLTNIVTDQFETVTVYDMSVYFDGAQDPQQQEAFREAIRSKADGTHFYYQTSVELDFSDSVRELYLVVSDEGIRDYIYLTEDGKDLGMPGLNEVFLSVGIAENMGIQVGDRILLRDSDMNTLDVTVSGIYNNMVYNYALVTPETYEMQVGTEPGYQMAFVNARSYADVHQVASFISGQEHVMNVMICQDTADAVNSMLEALDLLVLTIVVCAGALAVIVLYNLTNINITERIREIATIKVLGFHSMESAMYVFKENLLLSGMGVVVGLVMGNYLLSFVVSQIKVDFVHFSPNFTWISCVVAMILTMLAAVIVDFMLYFKLGKINMAEALKSVE